MLEQGERLDKSTGEVRGYLPKSVRRCLSGRFVVVRWRRDMTGEPIAQGYECGSWRCPRCRRKVAASDFVRLREGIERQGDWLYLVLTCPAREHSTRWAAWHALGHAWRDRLRNRLAREYGSIRYVQTWEQTRKGWPHLNVVLAGQRILEDVDALGWRERPGKPRVLRWRAKLRRLLQGTGFGRIVWVDRLWKPTPERPDPGDALAGYLAKLARELGDHTAKADQTPTSAPPGFRRLRASPGILPPRTLGRSTSEGTWARMIAPGDPTGWTWGRLSGTLGRRWQSNARSVPTVRGGRSQT